MIAKVLVFMLALHMLTLYSVESGAKFRSNPLSTERQTTDCVYSGQLHLPGSLSKAHYLTGNIVTEEKNNFEYVDVKQMETGIKSDGNKNYNGDANHGVKKVKKISQYN
ncbi:hypothetical protein CcBV_8.1 [Bracoviriform congregatae]|uniref:Uncharacterized protein n=1 Tax=Bracoviriform congregatae TaxID=39640 RepID=Q5ZP37_9VIRU|nr:hypothetical protein CcBV_8.1 [Bracoviriform congregatae]CAG17420.1 hypothetical protein CcBV_8.1 [Bracoviriform congregatae]